MTSTPTTADTLSAAARLLRLAAQVPDEIDDLVRLRCLSAVTHLKDTGDVYPLAEVEPGDSVDETIRQALRLLAALPMDEFSRPQVLDAAADARRALLLLG